MPRRVLIAVLLFVSLGTVGFLWLTDAPLGVDGEWTWKRIRLNDSNLGEAILGAATATIAAAVYLGFVSLGRRRMSRASRLETGLWLAGLVVAAGAWLGAVQQSIPGNVRLLKSGWVVYHPSSSGYFFEAAHHIQSTAAFLKDYERRMAEGDVLHVGTHPPGLFLLHRGAIVLCRRSPGLTRLVLETQPDEFARAFDDLATSGRSSAPPLSATDRAALWLGVLVTNALAAAAAAPLFLLIRGPRGAFHSREAAWSAAALWPLVPALALFLPKSDAMFPVVACSFLWLWRSGCAARTDDAAAGIARPVLCGLAAGATLWLGMFATLAFLPVALLAALLSAWEVAFADSGKRRATSYAAGTGLAAATCFGGLTVGFHLLAGVNLANVWRWNLINHSGFYEQFQRTWWKWTLINPVEGALAVGCPIVVAATAAFVQTTRDPASEQSERRRRLGPFVCCATVWILLWLSGKNMGEAARLWLILFLWPIWLAAGVCENRAISGGITIRSPWFWIAVCQAVVCIATVLRVDGFPLHIPIP